MDVGGQDAGGPFLSLDAPGFTAHLSDHRSTASHSYGGTCARVWTLTGASIQEAAGRRSPLMEAAEKSSRTRIGNPPGWPRPAGRGL